MVKRSLCNTECVLGRKWSDLMREDLLVGNSKSKQEMMLASIRLIVEVVVEISEQIQVIFEK